MMFTNRAMLRLSKYQQSQIAALQMKEQQPQIDRAWSNDDSSEFKCRKQIICLHKVVIS